MKTFLKLVDLEQPIPITLTQAYRLIHGCYIGSLEKDMKAAFKNGRRVKVLPAHPITESHGEVYLVGAKQKQLPPGCGYQGCEPGSVWTGESRSGAHSAEEGGDDHGN